MKHDLIAFIVIAVIGFSSGAAWWGVALLCMASAGFTASAGVRAYRKGTQEGLDRKLSQVGW